MKQAVVLIHGIGEQKPMETLRSFVSAILSPAADGQEQFWSKPDSMSKLFELRRLQTLGRTKTHFYEYYWAYHVDGTKLSHLGGWFIDLLFRRWCNIPKALRGIWLLSWSLTGMLAFLVVSGGLAYFQEWYALQLDYGPVWIVLTLFATSLQGFLVHYLGDAARYLSPQPRNIALRQKIRAEGILLLKQLHDSRDYDRIIIVGHSLGSVIGYDLVTQLWIDYNNVYDFKTHAPTLDKMLAEGVSPQPVIGDALFKAGNALSSDESPEAVERYRAAQLEGWKEQRQWGNMWRISDLVTLGSPLAHSMLLMSRNCKDFEARKRQRELPTCPPVKDSKGYAYRGDTINIKGSGRKFSPLILHHAAPFAVTRWTNIFFTAHFGLFGDIIGGPLRNVLGAGVKDIPVTLKSWRRFTPAAHTAYWKLATTSEKNNQKTETDTLAVNVLRRALELDRIKKFRVKS